MSKFGGDRPDDGTERRVAPVQRQRGTAVPSGAPVAPGVLCDQGKGVVPCMEPYIDDADFTLYVGDVLETLRQMPDESVHTVVTSPPYW